MPITIDELTAGVAQEQRFYGKYRGRVTDTADPRRQGRLRASVPEVLGEVQTGWALPCVPYAGDGSGWYTVPPTGAGVWIEFEAGDPSRPVWTGCWWPSDALPQPADGGETGPDLKILRTEQGMQLAVDDAARTIALSDADGRNLLRIDVQAGTIRLASTAKVVVDAPAIELVQDATHPLVFGDALLQYLNQVVQLFNVHLHPGQMAGPIPVTPAPPVSPLPPATPDLLSTFVKTG
jgi:hypothetical protein